MTALPSTLERVLRFYAVGLMGVFVQLAVLGTLTQGFSVNYLISTAVAVETAVIHNFFWHYRWTWRCRTPQTNSAARRLRHFWKFNFSIGMVSILTNMFLTRTLVEIGGVHSLIANLIAIVSGSLVTFLIGEILVFPPTRQLLKHLSEAKSSGVGCCDVK